MEIQEKINDSWVFPDGRTIQNWMSLTYVYVGENPIKDHLQGKIGRGKEDLNHSKTNSKKSCSED